MSGVMSTLTIWLTRSISEEWLQPMSNYGMISSLTSSEGSGTQEKKNDPGLFCNTSK